MERTILLLLMPTCMVALLATMAGVWHFRRAHPIKHRAVTVTCIRCLSGLILCAMHLCAALGAPGACNLTTLLVYGLLCVTTYTQLLTGFRAAVQQGLAQLFATMLAPDQHHHHHSGDDGPHSTFQLAVASRAERRRTLERSIYHRLKPWTETALFWRVVPVVSAAQFALMLGVAYAAAPDTVFANAEPTGAFGCYRTPAGARSIIWAHVALYTVANAFAFPSMWWLWRLRRLEDRTAMRVDIATDVAIWCTHVVVFLLDTSAPLGVTPDWLTYPATVTCVTITVDMLAVNVPLLWRVVRAQRRQSDVRRLAFSQAQRVALLDHGGDLTPAELAVLDSVSLDDYESVCAHADTYALALRIAGSIYASEAVAFPYAVATMYDDDDDELQDVANGGGGRHLTRAKVIAILDDFVRPNAPQEINIDYDERVALTATGTAGDTNAAARQLKQTARAVWSLFTINLNGMTTLTRQLKYLVLQHQQQQHQQTSSNTPYFSV